MFSQKETWPLRSYVTRVAELSAPWKVLVLSAEVLTPQNTLHVSYTHKSLSHHILSPNYMQPYYIILGT